MEKELSGKTAFIIGGSGGLGKNISEALAKEGLNLIIHGSNLEKLEKLKNQLQQLNSKSKIEVFHKKFDEVGISNQDFLELTNYIKSVDILIICYGPFLQKELHATSVDEWNKIVYWNYTFPGQMISSALQSMMKKKFGRILVFGGTRTFSINGYKTNSVYAGAKTALCSLVKSCALEYAKYGITCNAILPGFVETEYLSQEVKNSLKDKMPQGELIEGKSIAEAALFLIKNKSLNGVLLNVDEGWNP